MGSLINPLSSLKIRALACRFAQLGRNCLLKLRIPREAMLRCSDGKIRIGRIIAEDSNFVLVRVFWGWGPWGAMWYTWWLAKFDPTILRTSWGRLESRLSPYFSGRSLIAAP